MSPGLLVVAVAVLAGAVVAVSAREPRAAILGLAIALVASPALASPLPDPFGLAARILGAVLSAQLLWIATRDRERPPIDTVVGWPAELLGAVAAAFVGYGIAEASVRAIGPSEALAGGVALLFLALRPVAFGREPLRVGIGLLLLVDGALLARIGLLGAPGDLERLVEAGLVVAVAAAVAWRLRAAGLVSSA